MPIKARSKFNVSIDKTMRTYKDVVYDSELEMKFFKEVIEPKVQSGEIIKLETQVTYVLQPAFIYNKKKYLPIKYKSDFNVTYADGKFVVYDVKGLEKPMDVYKKKQMLFLYPETNITYIAYSRLDGGWVDLDKIKQGRKERKKLKQNKKDEA